MVCFDDDSIKGWPLVCSAHKQKHEHGVGFLLAPHVEIEEYEPSEDKEANFKVTKNGVIAPGYMINGDILRKAKVRVYQYTEGTRDE